MTEHAAMPIGEDAGKFANISSVQQLKHILKNYEALTESQHHLLNQSITKMSKIPPPDEITETFNRFQLLKDSEIEEFRGFLEDHKQILSQQYREIDNERKNFDDMQRRMEREKQVIAEDRERIAAEVRKIREMNAQLTKSLNVEL